MADLGFRGLDNDIIDPVIVTGYTASRTHKLTPGEKEANRVLAIGRAPFGGGPGGGGEPGAGLPAAAQVV